MRPMVMSRINCVVLQGAPFWPPFYEGFDQRFVSRLRKKDQSYFPGEQVALEVVADKRFVGGGPIFFRLVSRAA